MTVTVGVRVAEADPKTAALEYATTLNWRLVNTEPETLPKPNEDDVNPMFETTGPAT
jgi:hypothetical protein